MPVRKVEILIACAVACCTLMVCSGEQTVAGLISFDSGPEIFPPAWVADPRCVKAAPLESGQRERVATVVARALHRYPELLVSRTLKQVYLLGDLTAYKRLKYSGTATLNAVYLATKVWYDDGFIEARFHAEYSTLLLNRYLQNFDKDAWNKVNPAEFKYLGGNSWSGSKGQEGGAQAISKGVCSLKEAGPADLENGFLTEYSKSSIENDFNEYAAAIYRAEPRFEELAAKYPAIAKKRDVARKFYSATLKQISSKE